MKLPFYAKSIEHTGRGLEMFNQKDELFAEIKTHLRKNKKIKLLEIGSGRGILLSQLRKKFPKNLILYGLNKNKYHGIKDRSDFKSNALLRNIVYKENEDVPFIRFGNATNLPFKNNQFDLIVSQVTFIHIKNKAKALEEIYRLLKVGGLALISLGSYSINRQKGHKMPEFYKKIERELGKDYNPRFLILDKDKFIKFSHFIEKQKHNIELKHHKFISNAQRGNAFLISMRKEHDDKLKLNLKYNKSQSDILTKKYSKLNPVNYGCIDLYKFDKV